jgi:tRNA(Ile)-lysidine synthase
MNLADRVRSALARAGVSGEDRMLVACSYGPDSLALADCLVSLRPVTLCYVDHGLRAEAAREAEAVRAFAAARGVPVEVVRAPVDRRAGRGLEDAARRVRYRALAAAAAGHAWIALGHTASDQAETVLLRLLRGAGATGLAGMPFHRGKIIRPLLDATRADVLAYLAARGLEPMHDASNDDRALLRNRVRHELLPALRAFNPRVEAALVRAAASLREVADAIDAAADAARAAAVVERGDGWARLDAAAVAGLPAAVAKRLLFRLADELGASLEARHLDALWALARRPAAGTVPIDLPVAAMREYGALVLGEPPAPGAAHVTIRGDGRYTWRKVRDGDRLSGRKLQDMYTDLKIPRRLRGDAVVVVDESGAIVWAEHVGAAAASNVVVTLTRKDPTSISK